MQLANYVTVKKASYQAISIGEYAGADKLYAEFILSIPNAGDLFFSYK